MKNARKSRNSCNSCTLSSCGSVEGGRRWLLLPLDSAISGKDTLRRLPPQLKLSIEFSLPLLRQAKSLILPLFSFLSLFLPTIFGVGDSESCRLQLLLLVLADWPQSTHR